MQRNNVMMSEPHILIYSRQPESIAAWLQDHQCPGSISVADSAEAAQRVIANIEVLLCWRFPSDLLAFASQLRWVQSMGAGVDDILQTPYLRPEVVVTRIVGQFAGPVAEYIFAELLARVREIDRLRCNQRVHRWEHFIADTLASKILGVAGLGSIGCEVVRKARAFGMRIYGLSRTAARANLVDRYFSHDAWIDFVHDLDVLVLALPLTSETEGVITAEVLAAMPAHAILVNVSRGQIVREKDLIQALQERRIAGAILDVFAQEPLPADSPLWTLPGVTVTPHVAGPSTVEGVGQFFLTNLERYRHGGTLLGVVNKARGY
jgi:glyoxylate/hydroxypyruvate reductase A